MRSSPAPAKRSDALMFLLGVALGAPPLISLIHRQWTIPMADEIGAFVTSYRNLSLAIGDVLHAPFRFIELAPPAPLIDLHILSFAGMGVMTLALEPPGAARDGVHTRIWALASLALAWLLVGVLVLGAALALVLTRPLLAFRSDQYIETTPVLGGPFGRLRREQDMRLERSLARAMTGMILVVGGYFGLNALALS